MFPLCDLIHFDSQFPHRTAARENYLENGQTLRCFTSVKTESILVEAKLQIIPRNEPECRISLPVGAVLLQMNAFRLFACRKISSEFRCDDV
jgi:hypothetical protein